MHVTGDLRGGVAHHTAVLAANPTLFHPMRKMISEIDAELEDELEALSL